jgi:hydroxyacylglutathione hydrolase
VTVIDVRGEAEWQAGRLPTAPNVPLGDLADRAGDLPTDRPLVVYCRSGARSAIAASVLRAKGRSDVINLAGGFVEWQRSGNPTEPGGRDDSAGADTARRVA